MKFTYKNKIELGDTLIPDLFIINNMNSLELIDIKVYIYILYLLKNDAEIDNETLCKKLNISNQELSFSLDRLESEELISKNSQGFSVLSIKESEINKVYTPKLTPKKSKSFVQAEQTRTMAANAINESFFNGIMSFSWYNDIGILFDKYKFSEEVMIALFHHCNEKKALNPKYVYAVAEGWHKGGVKTFEELEEYLDKSSKLQIIMQKICKAMRLNRMLSKYEEVYVDRWTNEYSYDFEVIEEALKRTVASTTNPTFNYVNAILTNWYKSGYKTLEEVEKNTTQIKDKKEQNNNVKGGSNITSSSKIKFKNYEQREYKNLETYYDNM